MVDPTDSVGGRGADQGGCVKYKILYFSLTPFHARLFSIAERGNFRENWL